MKKQLQQGDVIIETKTIPAEAREVDRKGVVAEGEGHHEHAFSDPSVVQFFEFNDKTYIRVLEETELLHRTKGTKSHGEHRGLKLLKGEYEYRPVIERDWLSKLNRKVID
jgi:hypothetical protein